MKVSLRDFKEIVSLELPSFGVPYFSLDDGHAVPVLLYFNGFVCDDSWDIKVADECTFWSDLKWDVNLKSYMLYISNLCRSDHNIHNGFPKPISPSEYRRKNGYGPKRRLSLKINAGQYKGRVLECDFTIELPTPKAKNKTKNVKYKEESREGMFAPFDHHPSSDYIFGWAQWRRELGNKYVWFFNLNREDINYMSQKRNVFRPQQMRLFLEIYGKIDADLQVAVQEFGSIFKVTPDLSEDALRKYGDPLTFYLNTRYEILIKSFIQEFMILSK